MKSLLKQPLLHFLLLGGLFFLLFNLVGEEGPHNERTIVVDRDALLTHMQFRSKAFDTDAFNTRLDALSAEEKQKLIDDLVREEALFREAKSLGLDKGDYIIKRRVIQKLEFLTQGFSDALVNISDQELKEYYDGNKADYAVAPTVTFTHVFFDSERHGEDKARKLAGDKLAELNVGKEHFSSAPAHGDRFPYHVNYVERTPDFVGSHFGQALAEAVFQMQPSDSEWQGLLRSAYGYHVVMLSQRTEARLPELEEIKEQVQEDARRAQARMDLEKAYQAIIESYTVELADDL